MNLITKINGLSLLLCGVCMLLLFNFLINYWDYKSESPSSSFSRLSIRHVHKYARVYNYSSSISLPPMVPARTGAGSTVIFLNSSIPNTNSGTSNATAAPQDLKYFTSPQFEVRKVSPAQSLGQTTAATLLPVCEDPTEGGPFYPNTTLESLDIVEAELGPLLKPGGAFEPHDCVAKYHVAIVVPFRDRYAHLSVFLRNMHPFLMQQHIAYRIFIVEQTNGKAFNRAALMNIGFLEAIKIYSWDCFVFHDVDLLPLDTRNLYNCPRQPRHMSVAIDTLDFKLPYRTIFGGVSAMTREHFEAVNGFANSFFGWGGEDDDMSNRLVNANLFISRYPINIARYTMLRHQKEKASPMRYERLINGIAKMEMDGLNSIKYDIYSIKEFPVFTWYLAELKNSEEKT